MMPARRHAAAGFSAQWLDGDLYLTTSPAARKARDLAVSVARWRGRRVGVEGAGRFDVSAFAPQLDRLRAALDAGPAVHGWDEDQRWTLARVA
jgi:hypothetical protein